MEYKVESRMLAEQPTLAKRATLPIREVGPWLAAAYGEVFGYLARIGVAPVGPPYARFDMHDDKFDMEAGAPVAEPVPGEAGLVASSLPAGPAARTMHRGPYDTVDAAYDALRAWVQQHGGEVTGPHWENYLNDPREVPDPAGLLTEVLMPYREAVRPAEESEPAL